MIKDIANKCLKCKNARCQNACPISTPIAEILKLVANDEIDKAQEMLFENNPFSAVCGVICDHHKQCYGNCILNAKNDPVPFYKVEQELSSKYLKNLKLSMKASNGKRVAVVGGGPAGMSIALLLAKEGYKVTIFDGHEKLCGVLRYGIPQMRLSREIIDDMETLCINSNIQIRRNMLIGPVISVDDLLEDAYDAVFIGTGVWNPKKLSIKGETLGHVHYAIDYLKNPSAFNLNKKVLVIGAGNVAMDAARSAKLNGSDVYVYYRKGFEEMTASLQEIQDAKDDGVNFELFKSPIEITEDGVIFANSENIVDENGHVMTKVIEDSNHLVECDSVIIAISQIARRNIVSTTKELQMTKFGLLMSDEEGNTTKDGVFASGDVVSGSKTVVEAIAQSKIVAKTIMEYLENKKVD